MSLQLTRPDLDLLDALTLRVRLMTRAQVLDIFSDGTPGSLSTRCRRLRKLVSAGWLVNMIVNAHPLLEDDRAVFAWQPGQPAPDPFVLSRQIRGRWCQVAKPTTVYAASPLAANLFGSTASGMPPRQHIDHDLRMSSAYLRYRREQQELVGCWVGEHGLPKAGYRIKDPDAYLVDGKGRRFRVLESAGRYDHRQVKSFHEFCEFDLGVGYELF